MDHLDDLQQIKVELQQVAQMTRQQQDEISSLVEVTSQQSKMIDKMWQQFGPIIRNHTRREELKQRLVERLLVGGVYAACGGALLLVWYGFRFVLFNGES